MLIIQNSRCGFVRAFVLVQVLSWEGGPKKKRSLLKKLLNFLDYWIGSEQLSGFLVGEKSINVNWSLVFIHWGARCFFVFFSL